MKENPYEPRVARITAVKSENPEIRTFSLRVADGEGDIAFSPGQFIQLSVHGVGEIPLSICSPPHRLGSLDVCVRNAGNVTKALFALEKDDEIGVRGPYGNGYPLDKLKGKNIVLVAGGIGIPPLASLVDHIIADPRRFGKIFFLYGAKTPADLIFGDRLAEWSKSGVKVLVTVDKGDEHWDGNVGLVTSLFGKFRVKGNAGVACGPPVMMKFAAQGFREMGIKDGSIFLSMERMMQCGVGKCGHCNIGDKYVCTDGPVFSAEELNRLTENAWK
jgi:NAD(P)H-flavin reductase